MKNEPRQTLTHAANAGLISGKLNAIQITANLLLSPHKKYQAEGERAMASCGDAFRALVAAEIESRKTQSQ